MHHSEACRPPGETMLSSVSPFNQDNHRIPWSEGMLNVCSTRRATPGPWSEGSVPRVRACVALRRVWPAQRTRALCLNPCTCKHNMPRLMRACLQHDRTLLQTCRDP